MRIISYQNLIYKNKILRKIQTFIEILNYLYIFTKSEQFIHHKIVHEALKLTIASSQSDNILYYFAFYIILHFKLVAFYYINKRYVKGLIMHNNNFYD